MSNIKIFVSHRIDLDSICVDSPLYQHVRCGAVFDFRQTNLSGDNTGDNISAKRSSFNELTVQYWAWKNVEADYYGLCHYRRYFSFSDEHFDTDASGLVEAAFPAGKRFSKFRLTETNHIMAAIESADMIINETADVRRLPTHQGFQPTVYQHWQARDNYLIKKETLDLLLNLIKERQPAYFDAAKDYYAGSRHRGYNCHIMCRELFFRFCEFEYDILFELEKCLDTTGYTERLHRTPAYMGELLYGIFVLHIQREGKYRVAVRQLVLFTETYKTAFVPLRILLKTTNGLESAVWRLINQVLPIGSRRRAFVKTFYHRLKPDNSRRQSGGC